MTRERVGRCWERDLAMCFRELMDMAAEKRKMEEGRGAHDLLLLTANLFRHSFPSEGGVDGINFVCQWPDHRECYPLINTKLI